VLLSVVKIQQKEIPKVVDKGVERHYNRNKLASNAVSRCCRNTTKINAKSC
jgi:hypothetical protein